GEDPRLSTHLPSSPGQQAWRLNAHAGIIVTMLPYKRKSTGADDNEAPVDIAKNLDAISGLVKALVWPALAVAAFIDFHQPIREAVRVIPKKMSESQKLSVGGLSIEIEK